MDCLPHIHVAALHAPAQNNGATPGVGVLCRQGDELLGGGFLSNSHRKQSRYVVWGWQPVRVYKVRFGGVAGAIDGYPYKQGRSFPFAGLAVSTPHAYGEHHLIYLPKYKNISPHTLQYSVTVRF